MSWMLRSPWVWIGVLALLSCILALLPGLVAHGKPLQTSYPLLKRGMTLPQVQDSLGAENQPILVETDLVPTEGFKVQTTATWDDGRNQVRAVFGTDGQAKAISMGESGAPSVWRRMLDALGL
jgi:hypothetical protein